MKIRWLPLRFLPAIFLLPAVSGCLGPQVQSTEDYGPLGPQSDRARGEQRVLVVAAGFPDANPDFSLERIKRKAVKGLSRYVREQSYGLTWVNPDFRGAVMLPEPISEYKVSPYNFRVDRTRVRKLIEDVMTSLEGDVDFSGYDHLLIIPWVTTRPGKGYGMICYCANPGMLSGVRRDVAFVTVASKKGRKFNGGIFVAAENAHLGMFAHDFFHALGGIEGNRRLVP
ncbi:MAG: hypothetical protein JRK53_08435 [Deltaproteobacteria bacterium]|nr:hypothetical protein [Deltaproteobacteria bacterium]MBW1817223.1 hypothetical protein [Deltaproteobacteria bacterium]MBW2285297.1 hypothetical protein [Deltaproteobacteria bacterium]